MWQDTSLHGPEYTHPFLGQGLLGSFGQPRAREITFPRVIPAGGPLRPTVSLCVHPHAGLLGPQETQNRFLGPTATSEMEGSLVAISLNIPILWIKKWRSRELKGLIQSHTETAEGDLGLLIPRPLLFSTIITGPQSQPSPLSITAGHRSTWSGWELGKKR